MPLSTYLNLELGKLAHTKLTVELEDRTVKYPKGIVENVLVGIRKFIFPVVFIILDMPKDIKVPLILRRPYLSTVCAKINVYKRKITLRVGEERFIFTSVKPASSLIKRVYMLGLRERMELDLEARIIGETLVINRSLDPFFEDYIELNDLSKPFELRRNQGDDLMPTIEEGEVIEEFKTRVDELDTRIDDYPSYCDCDKKIHIEYKMVYKENNVVGVLMNVPIFVGTFSIVTDFAVLEEIDAYRDEGMRDVIFGEPFLREVRIKARRLEEMITIHNGNDEVTMDDPNITMKEYIRLKEEKAHRHFAVLENMDAYRNEGMGDVIFSEPLLREADIKVKWFEGMITLYKGDDEVNYQMVRSHPRYQNRNAHVFPIFYAGPRKGNIDDYWWRIYESGNLKVLES
ncbi:putative reverse transcriptase domain-containing protein [Tanacetum coccineum]